MNKTINSVQVLRFVAAALVVLSHVGDRLAGFEQRYGEDVWSPTFDGAFGVSIFFVISGFIMVHITLSKDEPVSPGSFLRNRVLRIVPLYWALTAAQCAYLAWSAQRGDSASAANLSTESVVNSLLFVPYLNGEGSARPVLQQGWTLNYEMAFYLIFAACLFFGRRWCVPLCAGFIAAFTFLEFTDLYTGEAISILAHPIMFDFALGMLLGLLRQQLAGTGGLFATAGAPLWAVGIVGLYAIAFPEGANGYVRTLFATAVVAIVVLSVDMDVRGTFARACVALGNSSYSLYLSHGFALLLVGMAWRKLFGVDLIAVYAAIAVAASLVVGWLCHRYLETPLSRMSRQLVAGPRSVAKSSAR